MRSMSKIDIEGHLIGNDKNESIKASRKGGLEIKSPYKKIRTISQ